MTQYAKNPIMPGFYPDPSICAVGEDFYLVNSTFAYFPGLPVLHSRDLVHWEQIGNVMERASQLPLERAGHSQGLFAPTIRYHEGVYYVICTNVSYGGNYVVTADRPEGPWSEPHYLEGADGIDPSLFFDTDGRCYYIGTHPNPEGCRYDGDWYIWIQELDLTAWKLVGEHKNVWNGAMRGVHWPEGPHLYKKGEYYYILHAEGGTGPEHAVSVCRSRDIWGPYENCFCNPILTHRHLGQAYPVKYVGHADLVETPAGEWYMTMLAVRPLEGHTTMGRETFLAKVTWENDWPVVNAGVGRLTDEVEVNLPVWLPEQALDSYTCLSGNKNALPGSDRSYDFTRMEALGDEFLYLRNPEQSHYNLEAGKGLCLTAASVTLKEQDSPSYVGIRQQHHAFRMETTVTLRPSAGDCKSGCHAGLALIQSNEYHLRLEASTDRLELILCQKGQDSIAGSVMLPASSSGPLRLYLQVNGLWATAGYIRDGKDISAAESLDIRSLSTETAGGFVGCTAGIYAAGSCAAAEDTAENYVVYTDLSYRQTEK
ncbi:MAG: glycoside hydrolase family 43 protein [Acetatifactor sp.]|nr:glycoside hydrolase family 43 protein [Acetatifactor sp.]